MPSTGSSSPRTRLDAGRGTFNKTCHDTNTPDRETTFILYYGAKSLNASLARSKGGDLL